MSNNEIKKIKEDLFEIKHPKLNKILQSEKIDTIIFKLQNIYHFITNKLIKKYNLEDELKQGKIFTILIAIISLFLLIVLTLFFAVTLNSILGIGLIFSFFRQIIFCLQWGYKIIKNKGKIIKKYLSNLFPNSKILKEVNERKNIPLFEEYILYQIEDFIDELDRSEIDLDIEKKILKDLKDIISELKNPTREFISDYHSLDYKKNISNRLSDLYNMYRNNVIKKEQDNEYLILKNDVLEQVNELNDKIYVKKKI